VPIDELSTHEPARELPCPRCAYDQSGAAREFTHACPLEGTCSECGLRFDWADVFFPSRRDVPWLVEHASGRRATFRAAWATWARAALPAVFFRALRIEHRVVLGRILLWPLLVLLPVHALASTLAMVRLAVMPRMVVGGRGGAVSPAWLDYFSVWLYPMATVRVGPAGWVLRPEALYAPRWVIFALAMHLAFAALVLMLGASRSRAGVGSIHAGHVLRAAVYGLWWVVLLALFRLGRNLLVVYETLTSEPGPNVPWRVWGAGPIPVWLSDIDPALAATVASALVAVWWLSAIVIGWRLQRGWTVWGLLTITAALTGMVALLAVERLTA
jgi:hypothetical protein